MTKSKLSKIFIVIFCLSLTGCQWVERRKATMQFNTLSTAFETKVSSGQTTREQEQAYIKAVSGLAFQIDRSVRGTKSAEKTKQQAELFGKTGIDLSRPLEISSPKDINKPVK